MSSGTVTPEKPPEWLLMVHMLASAPNLEQPLGMDLKELSRPLKDLPPARDGRPPVAVYVQIDAPTGVSKRFRLRDGRPEPWNVHDRNPVFPTRASTTLSDFVNEVSEAVLGKVPADQAETCPDSDGTGRTKTALVVWGHASGSGRGVGRSYVSVSNSVGTPKDVIRQAPNARVGKRPPRKSNGAEVAQAGSVWAQLSEVQRCLDIVGFDACYMACVEVVYQLIGHVRYVLAPQPGIGLEGWHYDLFLDQMIAGKETDEIADEGTRRVRSEVLPRDLGLQVVSQVGLTASSPEALSFVDVSAIGELATRIRVLTKALADAYDAAYRESQMRRLIHEAFEDAAWAGVRQFLDLGDLCRVLACRIPDPRVRIAAQAVLGGMSSETPPSVDSLKPKDLLAHIRQVASDPKASDPETSDPKAKAARKAVTAHEEKIDKIEFKSTGPLVDHLSVLDTPLSGLSIYCPWPRSSDPRVHNVDVDQREYLGERKGIGLLAHFSDGGYEGLDFAVHTGWGDFVFQKQRMRDAEQRWMRDQVSIASTAAAAVQNGYAHNGYRPDDTKPASRQDSKPAPRADDSKPAGRADDSKPAGRDDSSKPSKRSEFWTF